MQDTITVRRLSYAQAMLVQQQAESVKGLRQYDALAYDKTPEGPSNGRKPESTRVLANELRDGVPTGKLVKAQIGTTLLSERKSANKPLEIGIVVNVRAVLFGGALVPYTPEWYRANSDKHGVLKPVANLCGCCGYRDCMKPTAPLQHPAPVGI